MVQSKAIGKLYQKFLEQNTSSGVLSSTTERPPALPTPQVLPPLASLLKRSATVLTAHDNRSDKKHKSQKNIPPTSASSYLLNDPLDIKEIEEQLNAIYTLLTIRHISEPKTYKEAMQLPEALQ
ncbi:unnamed protein product [Phytophthora lilii]|uniref:Unnamed protein product n=1 Tax=Phytophthora lilii TaxID=2077276 RepID=A0A9W6TS57_9STRA|nr:unnamed protein product [Phytophthora lilii]